MSFDRKNSEWKKFDPAELPPVPKYVPKVDKTSLYSKEANKSLNPSESEDADYEKIFLNLINKFSNAYNIWDVFRDFVILTATSVSNVVDKFHREEREKLYLSTFKKYKQSYQMIFPEMLVAVVNALEKNPDQDFLGNIFMKLNLGNHALGQIFTPYPVCKLMSEIVMINLADSVKKNGFVRIDDPCCGAGGILIAGINKARDDLKIFDLNFQNHILVTGQDVDQIALLMCYIQISLLGVAGYFKVGDSLTEPMSSDDSLENYWFTPMYFSDIWQMRRFVNMINEKAKEDSE